MHEVEDDVGGRKRDESVAYVLSHKVTAIRTCSWFNKHMSRGGRIADVCSLGREIRSRWRRCWMSTVGGIKFQ